MLRNMNILLYNIILIKWRLIYVWLRGKAISEMRQSTWRIALINSYPLRIISLEASKIAETIWNWSTTFRKINKFRVTLVRFDFHSNGRRRMRIALQRRWLHIQLAISLAVLEVFFTIMMFRSCVLRIRKRTKIVRISFLARMHDEWEMSTMIA